MHCLGRKADIHPGARRNGQDPWEGSLYFHNLGGAPHIFDSASGKRRLATVQDVSDATRLLDALENCHTITPFFTPTEVPGGVMSLAMYRHALPYTFKPLQGPGVQFAAEVRYAVKMAEVIGRLPKIDPLAFACQPTDHSGP